MTIGGRFTLYAALTSLCCTLMLLATLVYQNFEQQKLLWTSVLEARLTGPGHWPSTLHFRNTSLAEQGLGQLAPAHQIVWSLAQHVDGEVLASLPIEKGEGRSPILERSGIDRLATLVSTRGASDLILLPPGQKLSLLPFMDRLVVISVPVFSAIDPLRTDLPYEAYRQQQFDDVETGARYVSAYIEQGAYVGDLLLATLAASLPAIAWMAAVLSITLLVIHFQTRSLTAPLLHMARVAESIDTEELPKRGDLPPGSDESMVRITAVLNGMVDGMRQMRTKLDVDRSLMELRADSTSRKLDRAQAEVDKTRHQIHRVSYFDPITGLANRRLMLEHLSLLIQIAARERKHLGIALLDISDIRKIQETKGRETADRVQRKLADRLVQAVRASDVISHEPLAQDIARLEGDEFCVVMHGIYETDGAVSATRRLLEVLTEPVRVGREKLSVNSCAGVAIAPLHARNPEELVRAADVALSCARSENPGEVAVFDVDMDKRGSERFWLEADLRAADFDREFYLVYQPQVDPGTGSVLGMEALLRWRQPDRGEVPPVKFIPIAEQTGLMETIGAWVLRKACSDLSSLKEGPSAPPRVSVNISTTQLNSDFVKLVRTAMQDYHIEAGELGLELTESILVESVSGATAHLKTLREELGIHLSIDDFGTGYSSLAYLSKLSLDELKVDRGFVIAMEYDEAAVQLTEAIVAIGKKLDLLVVVEGVETAEQLSAVERMGVTSVQGYYFSKPLTLEQLPDFLAKAGEA